jgi:hypothetical protein
LQLNNVNAHLFIEQKLSSVWNERSKGLNDNGGKGHF